QASIWVEKVQSEPVKLRVACALQHIVDAAAGDSGNSLRKADSFKIVDHVGGTEFPRQGEPARLEVHCDDGICANRCGRAITPATPTGFRPFSKNFKK